MLNYNTDTQSMSIIAKDTGSFVVSLDNYILDDGDTVYFTVNDQLEGEEPKIQKIITSFNEHKAVIMLTSQDTDLPVGKYYYDVQINTADGRVDTVIGPHSFKVLGGVTY